MSHLSAMFGLVEVCAELIETLLDSVPVGFEAAWLEYCRYFNATAEEQVGRFGESFGRLQLVQGHSRLTAYAAARLGDASLAQRAWKEFVEGEGDGYTDSHSWHSNKINETEAILPISEAPWVSTNITALYALAAIQNLALISEDLEVNRQKSRT